MKKFHTITRIKTSDILQYDIQNKEAGGYHVKVTFRDNHGPFYFNVKDYDTLEYFMKIVGWHDYMYIILLEDEYAEFETSCDNIKEYFITMI